MTKKAHKSKVNAFKKCVFKKGRDIMEVVPDASVDITQAIFDGTIKDAQMPKLYNGFESIEQIGKRPTDVFDMEDYSHEVSRLKDDVRKELEKV